MNKSVWSKNIANGFNLMIKVFTVFNILQALKLRREIYEEPYAMNKLVRLVESERPHKLRMWKSEESNKYNT